MILNHNYADGFNGLKTNRMVSLEAPEGAEAEKDAAPAGAEGDGSKDVKEGQTAIDKALGDLQVVPGPKPAPKSGSITKRETVRGGQSVQKLTAKVGLEDPDTGEVDFVPRRSPEQEKRIQEGLAEVNKLMGPLQAALEKAQAELSETAIGPTGVEKSGVVAEAPDTEALDKFKG